MRSDRLDKEFVRAFALHDASQLLESLIDSTLNSDPKLRSKYELALARLWKSRLEHYKILWSATPKEIRKQVEVTGRGEARLIDVLAKADMASARSSLAATAKGVGQ